MKEKKKENIVARCTKEEKDRISRKAKAVGKSESRYILDCCIAGTERKSDKFKKILIQQVQVTEEINQLRYIMEKNKAMISPDCYLEVVDQVNKIGGIAKCQF